MDHYVANGPPVPVVSLKRDAREGFLAAAAPSASFVLARGSLLTTEDKVFSWLQATFDVEEETSSWDALLDNLRFASRRDTLVLFEQAELLLAKDPDRREIFVEVLSDMSVSWREQLFKGQEVGQLQFCV